MGSEKLTSARIPSCAARQKARGLDVSLPHQGGRRRAEVTPRHGAQHGRGQLEDGHEE
jgi:hypothetical protein